MPVLYNMPFAAAERYGTTMAALSLLAVGKYGELYSRILERYKALESRCDIDLCLGIDYTGVPTALEFDFNIEVARNRGITAMPIINIRDACYLVLMRSNIVSHSRPGTLTEYIGTKCSYCGGAKDEDEN
jgi:hypothetical protein